MSAAFGTDEDSIFHRRRNNNDDPPPAAAPPPPAPAQPPYSAAPLVTGPNMPPLPHLDDAAYEGAANIDRVTTGDELTPTAPGAGEQMNGDFTNSDATYQNTNQYDTQTVDPSSNSTVAGQMTGLLSRENPYIREARIRAAAASNSRGLINSSIAARQGERAAIESALPIAQQDASTSFAAQRANQDALNNVEQQRQALDNTVVANQQQHEGAIKQGEQAFEANRATKEQEQRQAIDRLTVDQMHKENMEILNTTTSMYKDENKAALAAQLEQFTQNARVNAEQKVVFVQESNRILIESQTAIREISISTQSAATQAKAIEKVIQQRDANLELLQTLIIDSSSWSWPYATS